MIMTLQLFAQVATQPTADQINKAADAASKAAEAANKTIESNNKLATSMKALAEQVPVLSDSAFAMLLVTAIAIIMLIAMALIYRNVRADDKWSIADALSEEVPVGALIKDKDDKPILDKDNQVQHENIMKASSSRLIALLGAVSIMMLYIGAGLSVLMQFTSKGTVPDDTKEFAQFFLWGMVLFAPYIVNKFSSIFSWLK